MNEVIFYTVIVHENPKNPPVLTIFLCFVDGQYIMHESFVIVIKESQGP